VTAVCSAPGAVLHLSEDARAAIEAVVPLSEPTPADGTDWWPIAKVWARQGRVPAAAAAVARPVDTTQVAALLAVCARERVPVTPAGARSGVCGGAVPVAGGVVLDLTGLDAIVGLDEESSLVTAQAGVMGGVLEAWLSQRGYSTGHFPQSIDISTVGGWVACRSAGQWSTRYGKVEDMVRGLEVVLADGSVVRIAAQPARSTGPDVLRLFCGSEGTLGVITEVTLTVHPVPPAQRLASYRFDDFTTGLRALRAVARRGARPPVLRLYDERETNRQYADHVSGGCILLTLTEGETGLVEWEATVLDEECGSALGTAAVEAWMHHRNDVSALDTALDRGFVVDTCEVAAPWARVEAVYDAGIAALRNVAGTVSASGHCSHVYGDGACLYFTLAGHVGDDAVAKDRWYADAWGTLLDAVGGAGATVSHHHGIGLLRAAAVPRELGSAAAVVQALKDALDPVGILNPGKMGLADRLGVGAPAWPAGSTEET